MHPSTRPSVDELLGRQMHSDTENKPNKFKLAIPKFIQSVVTYIGK